MKKLIFILLFSFIIKYISAQDRNIFLNSVVYIESKSDTIIFNLRSHKNDTFRIPGGATGFFIYKNIIIDSAEIVKKYLITNKHCLPIGYKGNDSVTLRVLINKNGGDTLAYKKIDYTDNQGNYKPYVSINKTGSDVAVIDITEFWNKYRIINSSIDYNLIVTDSLLKKWDFNIGDEINIIGYPSSIYNEKNTYPILRQGVISTNPIEKFYFGKEYQKKYDLPEYIDGFLIDASIFPGSSGSMVYYYPPKLPITKGIRGLSSGNVDRTYRKTPFLIGIISGSFQRIEFGYEQSIDLATVYSYKAIKETIDNFIYK